MWFVLGVSRSVSPVSHYRHEGLSVTEVIAHESVTLPVAFTRTIETSTLWIRTRESGISLLRWRRQCHNSPPVARNGLKDTGSTPVSPRYYSPGLPLSTSSEYGQVAIDGPTRRCQHFSLTCTSRHRTMGQWPMRIHHMGAPQSA